MITTPTVFVLGAGASVPYGFSTGQSLLLTAKRMKVSQLQSATRCSTEEVKPLFEALGQTAEASIDAMLEHRSDIELPGKRLIACLLLHQEREALRARHAADRTWIEFLWDGLRGNTADDFKANAANFITYNYDRMLEYRLSNALHARFKTPLEKCAQLVSDRIIHLHGQLGYLPGSESEAIVHYGGSGQDKNQRVIDDDVLAAAREIKIVHQAMVDSPPFETARHLMNGAQRIIFLGFGFNTVNVQRLFGTFRLHPHARILACGFGMTHGQQLRYIQKGLHEFRAIGTPENGLVIGEEHLDIRDLIRTYPDWFS